MKRILVIEDDAAQRQLFQTALTGAGYDVLTAADGAAGVELYRAQPCDLIITDIFMPKADGIETIFDLKHENSQVKIIAISGGGVWAQDGRRVGADEPLGMATHFGADRALRKPIKIQQLLATVAELLNLQDRPQERRPAWQPLSQAVAQKRILVIEDDPAQRQLFETALTNAGYEVVEAPDGQAGLRLYQDQPCDLIVTDIFMPKADGLETIFDLRSQHAHVKIIAISGGGSWAQHGSRLGADDTLTMAQKFGADRILQKPVKLQRLVALADELLGVQGRFS